LLGINIRTDLGYNNDVSIIEYGYILEQSVNNAEDIKQVRTGLSFLDYKDKIKWINEWIGSDGEGKQISPKARAYFYKVVPGDVIKMSLGAITGSSDYYHYAFFNSEEPSASSLMAEYSYIREYNKSLNVIVQVPEGAVLIGISVFTDKENYISFESGNKILELSNEVQNIKKDIALTEESVTTLDATIFGMKDLDIVDTLTWTNGVWHYEVNGGYGADYIKQTFRYSNKIDISGYDSVKLSGLMNGSSISASGNTVPTIIFFGDGEPIGWKMYQPGESFVVLTTDYSQYNKLEIVLNAYQSEATYVPSIKVTKVGGLSNDVKDLKKESASVGETVSELKTSILGVDNVDIADTINWTNGCWHFESNQGAGSPYMQQTYRYSNKIDISGYDEVKLSGLWNGGPSSTKDSNYPTITYFGDGNPIGWRQYKSGESFIIYRSDYKDYDKLEIVLNAFQSEETYVPSVIVNKNSVFEGEFIPKRIVVCGDSLSGNNSALLKLQLDNIAKAMGYEIILNAMGGENIIGNLTRNGGIGIRVTADFVMPASGSVDIEVESAWMKSDGTYAQNPYNNASNRDVRIMGIKGKMTRNSSASYTFTRNDEGESFKVGIGTLLWDEALWSCKDYPHIWFTGQNMGYENEQDWADMINMAARNFGENFIVCSTALSGTTNQLVRCATKTFGNKYINLKAYTEGQAVYDGQRFGLIDSSALASDYGSLFWPGTDKVHQNNLLSYMWAVLMWNTLLDLGYVEGNRINTGDYYKQ
jgi:hypothetical protein